MRPLSYVLATAPGSWIPRCQWVTWKVWAAVNPGTSVLRAMDGLIPRGFRPTTLLRIRRLVPGARGAEHTGPYRLRMLPLPLARHLFYRPLSPNTGNG
jgi:hypothetical protein